MRPRMYGSTLMKRLRTRTCPSPGSSCGRRARRISRVSMARTVGSRAMDLAGRHIVVTGGASGIGRACALRFADEGARVTVADLDLEGARASTDGLAVRTDVGSEQDVRELIARAEEVAPIDAFFSNAGITGPPG